MNRSRQGSETSAGSEHSYVSRSHESTVEDGYSTSTEIHTHSSVASTQRINPGNPLVLSGTSNDRFNIHAANLRPIRTCLVLSLSFNLVYTAFNGIQNIQSSINSERGVGVITLAVMYGVVLLSGPIAPSLLRILGGKALLLIAWVVYGLYIGANFYPGFSTIAPASVLVGIISGYIGTLSGMYNSAISDSYVEKKNLSPERHHGILSLFNGVFFMFFESTQVTGNLISSLVFYTSTNATSSSNIGSNSSVTCGANICAHPAENSTAIVHPSNETIYILLDIFLGCILLGFLLTAFFLPRLPLATPTSRQSICRELSSCYRMLLDKRFALLVPLFMGQGMIVMILYTGFTKAFVTCSLGIQWVGFVMMAYGTSTALFSTLANYSARYLGRVVLIVTFIIVDVGILCTMLIWTPSQSIFNVKVALFTIAGVAGISEGISQPQFNALVSTVFKDKLAPAFVAYMMCKCVSFTISLAISSFACLYHRLYVSLSLYGVGLVGYIITEVIAKRTRDDEEGGSFDERKPLLVQ